MWVNSPLPQNFMYVCDIWNSRGNGTACTHTKYLTFYFDLWIYLLLIYVFILLCCDFVFISTVIFSMDNSEGACSGDERIYDGLLHTPAGLSWRGNKALLCKLAGSCCFSLVPICKETRQVVTPEENHRPLHAATACALIPRVSPLSLSVNMHLPPTTAIYAGTRAPSLCVEMSAGYFMFYTDVL